MQRKEFVVKDSGKRESFNTGAVRDTDDTKTRPDLISPFFLDRLGHHLRKGAQKYQPWNWAKGIPSSRCYASCIRHLLAYAKGQKDEDHLAAAAFNIMAIIHNEETENKYNLIEKQISGSAALASLNDMPLFELKDN